MTGPWVLTLNYPRAPKGLSANDRAHWRTKAKSTAEVRQLVFLKTRAAGVPALEKCRVDVEWVVNTRGKRDPDNLAPFTKAIYDAIGSDRGVSARIVEDDSPEFMSKPSPTIRYERLCVTRFLVTITEEPA